MLHFYVSMKLVYSSVTKNFDSNFLFFFSWTIGVKSCNLGHDSKST